ncbi:TcpD family membrane protein [Leuconostoc lactis]|uniref:TcpD family membrane protein n=1 Tax=Leuconostoc lactis TaxID=1246 RepID=UPI0024AD26C6|nr:TcpD family membrane protein [Leuconostoc lactis]MDI6572941.1 TcpD family membrane protein [Leuconostoc lactis]
MDIYNAVKPVLLIGVALIAGSKAISHYGKNETKQLWITLGLGGLIFFFVNGPQKSLAAFDGLMNALLNFISGLGG